MVGQVAVREEAAGEVEEMAALSMWVSYVRLRIEIQGLLA